MKLTEQEETALDLTTKIIFKLARAAFIIGILIYLFLYPQEQFVSLLAVALIYFEVGKNLEN